MTKEFVEHIELQQNAPEGLKYKKVELHKGFTAYYFKNVVVGIDTTGKNYKKLPEILFGTFDEGEKPSNQSMHKPNPNVRKIQINMENISECLKEACKDSGINKFWCYPFEEDSKSHPDRRGKARAKLFQQYFKLEPAENNYGYIVTIE
jgi:hypothetical protein